MAKSKVENEKTVDVELVDGTKTQVVVKRPSNRITSEAQRRGAVVWNRCIQDGIMTKKELEKFMKEKGIWDDAKEGQQKVLVEEINSLEKQIYLSKGRVKIGKAKDLAISMRRKRVELRDLLTEKVAFETNTAESLSENTKFDYIVAHCTFHTNGTKVYDSLEAYETQADDPVAYAAAQALAEMMFAMDKDFEASLPENKFLKKFKLVNEDLSLINREGNLVDTEGRLINADGHFLDGDGNRIDKEGNLMNEDGTYVIQATYLDEDGKVVKLDDKASKKQEDQKEEETNEESDTPDS